MQVLELLTEHPEQEHVENQVEEAAVEEPTCHEAPPLAS